MKELEVNPSEIGIHSQVSQEKKKGIKHFKSVLAKKGHKIFKYCIETDVISELGEDDYYKIPLHLAGLNENIRVSKKILIKKGHLYVSALNVKNAKKQIVKILKPNFSFDVKQDEI